MKKPKKSKEKNAPNSVEPEEERCDIQISIFIISFLIYGSTCYRSVPGGDSSELIVAAQELGIPHPPGYPLLAIMLKMWNLFVPAKHIAWSSALLNSFLAALCNTAMYTLVEGATRPSVAIIATTVFGFSGSVWEWASNLEVFTLNNLLCTMLLICFRCYLRQPSPANLRNGVIISGLCLTNQHTSVLYVIPIALMCLVKERHNIGVNFIITNICHISLPLSLYMYLPLSSMFAASRWTWGDCSTIDGILTHVLRSEYGTFSLASGHSQQLVTSNLMWNFHFFVNEFGWSTLIAALASILFMFKSATFRQRSNIVPFVSLFCFYTLFFAWRSNLDPTNMLYYGVVQRFYLQNSIIVVYLASLSLNEALKLLNLKTSAIHVATVVSVTLIATRYKANNFSSLDIVQNFGHYHIDAFPPNSVVLMKGDLPANTFRFIELIEKRRSDVYFIDTQPMTYTWYLKNQRERFPFNFPGDKYSLDQKAGSFSLQDLIRSCTTGCCLF